MPGTPWRARLAALGATTAIVVAACGGAATPTPAPSRRRPRPTHRQPRRRRRSRRCPTRPPPRSTAPPATYNGKDYTGTVKSITAHRREDRRLHPLRLRTWPSCRRSRSASFAINDTAYLEKAVGRRLRSSEPERHRAVQAQGVESRATSITLEASPTLTGASAPKAPKAVLRWSTEAAQRLVELQSGNADGIDNPGTDDFDDDRGRPDLKLYPREGLNVFYVGHEQHATRRSTTRRSARRSPWASTASGSSTTSCRRAPGRHALHAVRDPEFGCDGRRVVRLRRRGGQGAPRRGRLPGRLQDHDPATATSSAATCPSQTSSPRTSRPSSRPTSTSTPRSTSRSRAPSSTTPTPASSTASTSSGWGADYPDVTNFLDYHFGAGASDAVRRQVPRHRDRRCQEAPQGADRRRSASRPTSTPTTRSRPTSRWCPISHAALGDGLQGRRRGRPHARRSATRCFSVMKPARPRPARLHRRTASRSACTAPTRPTARPSASASRSTESLYGFEIGGTDVEPGPRRDVRGQHRRHLGLDLHAARGRRRSRTAPRSTPTTSSSPIAAQWDAEHPLHVGHATAPSRTSRASSAGSSTRRRPE